MSEGDQANCLEDFYADPLKALDQTEFYANKCVDAGNNMIQSVILSEDTKH